MIVFRASTFDDKFRIGQECETLGLTLCCSGLSCCLRCQHPSPECRFQSRCFASDLLMGLKNQEMIQVLGPVTHAGDQDGVPGSWLLLRLALMFEE